MKKILPCLFLLLLFAANKSVAQLSATTTSTNPGCINSSGSATVAPAGGSGYTYKWSNGVTTATANNLAAGTYTVTVYSSGGAIWDTIYSENFDGTPNWTLNVSTGANDADNNYWDISGGQFAGGAPSGSCVSTSTTDRSLHITSSSQVYPGATYDAGSQGNCVSFPGFLFCTTTNMAAQSPNINTNGAHNMVLQYDFIGNGQDTTDNGSSFYSNNGGTNFTMLDASLKSALCGTQKGVWTTRSYNLPTSSNNLTNFKIRFNWTNDDDANGVDPSVALNNVLLRDSTPGTADSIVKTVTLSQPAGPHFVTAALSVVNPGCGQQNGSINNMGVAGGTPNYTLMWKTGGAQIGTGNSLTNLGPGTYTFEVSDANGCVIDTDFILVTSGGGGSSTITTSKPAFCANDSTHICVSGNFTTYLWNTGATSQCITVHLSGNYYVTVTDNTGCSAASNHLAIAVYPLPPVSISVNGDTLIAHNANTYQWYLNGNLINGATDSLQVANQGGVYTVVVTDSNSCEATSNITISGLNEAISPQAAIRIFPNPFFDEFVVYGLQFSTAHEIPYEVFDISGRKIVSSVFTESNKKIQTTNWDKGIYFLMIGNDVKKLVKQ